MPDALFGFGTLFKIRTSTGPDVYTTIGRQTGVKPPGFTVDEIDTTHEESPSAERESMPGLLARGDSSFDMHYLPGGTAVGLLAARLRQIIVCRIVYPDGSRDDFSGYLTAFDPDAPMDNKLVCTVKVKVTGPVVQTAAAAPSNSVKPGIAGASIQVGVLLTAWEGVWAGEPTSFTYQWKNAGVSISGETAKTYTPVVGDVGDVLTVTVTGVNSAGSAAATSAPASDVLAA